MLLFVFVFADGGSGWTRGCPWTCEAGEARQQDGGVALAGNILGTSGQQQQILELAGNNVRVSLKQATTTTGDSGGQQDGVVALAGNNLLLLTV